MLKNLRIDSRGFTLIEIMVVIIILGILAVYIGPKIMGRPGEAKQVKAKVDISALETALKLYSSTAVVTRPRSRGCRPLLRNPKRAMSPRNGRRGAIWIKVKFPKTPGATNSCIFLREFTAILISFPMVLTGSPAVKARIRMSTAGKSNNFHISFPGAFPIGKRTLELD